MSKKILIIIIILAAGILIWQFWPQKQVVVEETTTADTVEKLKQGPIASYSFRGEVLKLQEGSLVVEAKRFENGVQVPKEIMIGLNAGGEVYIVTLDSATRIGGANPLSQIKVGDKVAVYGKGNPYTSDFLMSNRIEILR